MDVDRCVVCGNVIPEGRQVCPICMAGCEGCGWEDRNNCKVCRGRKIDLLPEVKDNVCNSRTAGANN